MAAQKGDTSKKQTEDGPGPSVTAGPPGLSIADIQRRNEEYWRPQWGDQQAPKGSGR